jgi:hypothetical protein
MMLLILILRLVADLALAPHPAPPPRDVGDRLIAECPEAKLETPACKALVEKVETLLIRELMFIEAARLPVDKKLVREAAGSANCGVVGAALKVLAATPIEPGDEPAIIDALVNPCPGVRRLGFLLAGKLADKSYTAWQKRSYVSKDGKPPILPYVEDVVPSEKRLGVSLYPGADYVYFASGRKRAFYFTTDAPEKVIAFYAKGGKRVFTTAELESTKPAAPDQNEIMRRMRSGEDPKKVIAELQAQAGTASVSKQWLVGIKGEEGIADPRFIEVVPLSTGTAGAVTLPRAVVVFRDDILGGTAIVVARPDRQPALPTSSATVIEDSWAQQALDAGKSP